MIGGNIEKHGDRRAEKLGVFELKRTHFQDQEIQITRPLCYRRDGQADVSGRDGLAMDVCEHPLHQLGCGGLSVGAANSDVQAERLLESQLQLRDERNLAFDRLDDQLRAWWNPW